MAQANQSQPNYEVAWEWQSNPNPWSSEEEEQWTKYPNNISKTIETAFLQEKSTAFIGEYNIDLEQSFQYKVSEPYRMRMVKRTVIQGPERVNRFYGAVPKPKTAHEAFGNIWDFILYLEKKYETSVPSIDWGSSSESIAEAVSIVCLAIKKEAESLSIPTIKTAETIVKDIQESSVSFKSFYKAIVKVYTKETFVYQRVNGLLREENWKGLTNLMPFVSYLARAFQMPIWDAEKDDNQTLYLFRGTTLHDDMISFYDPAKVQYFSWHAFTSATKCSDVAFCFSQNWEAQPGYSSVVFVIETRLKGNRQIASISRCSVCPNEQELLIAPATVFKILGKSKLGDVHYVYLRIVLDPQGTLYKKGVGLRGQSMINLAQLTTSVSQRSKTVKIQFLSDIDIPELLHLLDQGTPFIKKVEIGFLYFSTVGMTQFMKALCNLSLESIHFRDTAFQIGTKVIAEILPETQIKTLSVDITDPFNIMKGGVRQIVNNKSFKNLHELELRTRSLNGVEYDLDSEVLIGLCSILPGTQIAKLSFAGFKINHNATDYFIDFLVASEVKTLSFDNTEFSSDAFDSLITGTYLSRTKLESLSLSVEFSDSLLKKLIQVLPSTLLTHLFINISGISDEGLNYLADNFSRLNLKKINLRITYEQAKNFNNLAQAIYKSSVQEFVLIIDSKYANDKFVYLFDELFSGLTQSSLASLKVEATVFLLQDLEKLLSILPELELSALGLPVNLFNLRFNSKISKIARQDEENILEALKEKLPLTKIQNLGIKTDYAAILDYRYGLSELMKFMEENNIKEL